MPTGVLQVVGRKSKSAGTFTGCVLSPFSAFFGALAAVPSPVSEMSVQMATATQVNRPQ